MDNIEAKEEATRILINKHWDEFQKIYTEKKREIERHGGILK